MPAPDQAAQRPAWLKEVEGIETFDADEREFIEQQAQGGMQHADIVRALDERRRGERGQGAERSRTEGNQGAAAVEGAVPNADKAQIDPRKATEYALNPEHPVGGNKARVFDSALGFNQANAADLIRQLQEGVTRIPAQPGKADQFGGRYTVDIPVVGPKGLGIVRTGWIVRPGSDTPVLTTMFVK